MVHNFGLMSLLDRHLASYPLQPVSSWRFLETIIKILAEGFIDLRGNHFLKQVLPMI